MQIRIDVENSAGTKLGYGPIMSATDWKITTRLDRAGEFSFSMPMADPQYATLITGRNYVRCWELINGTMTQIGLGIVDTIDEDSNADPTMATVSGSNIMRELTWRSVKGLLIAEPGYVLPDDVHRIDLDAGGSGAEANPNNYAALPNTFDGNTGTWSDISTITDKSMVYIGYSRPFSTVKFILHTFNSTIAGSTTKAQYFNGTDWIDLTFATNNFVDGTYTTLAFGQDGSWTFNVPADWVPLVQDCKPTATVTHNNRTDYWLRFHVTPGTYQNVVISEITMLTTVPTLTGAQLIMALAPAGWSLTGYTTTLSSVYLQYADETVLEALGTLASITGEHFRLSGTASSRQIEWIRTDATDSGVTAFRNFDPTGYATGSTNPNACMIQRLKTTHDSIDMVSRVIPYGAGQAGARTTLKYTTRSAPGGYTLDAANNFLKHNASEAAFGQVERAMTWNNIGPGSAATADLAPASNALFDAALYWLSTHATVVNSYALTVYGLTATLKVGDTIRVVWLEVADGVAIRNVDASLIILEGAYSLDRDGTYSAALMVSNLARWPLSETDALAKLMGNVKAMSSISQSASIGTMSTPTLALSVKLTSAGFGGLNYAG